MMVVTNSILKDVAAGRPEAMAECVNRFGGLIWSLAKKFCHSSAEAETITLKIFDDVWRNASRYRQTKCSEKIFITMLARRQLVGRNRNSIATQVQDADLKTLSHTNDNMADGREMCPQVLLVREHLNKLPDDQAKVLRLAIHQGLPALQIAEMMGVEEESIRSHLRNGLQFIRKVLNPSQE